MLVEGRYRLLRTIGSGGMAQVFEAVASGTGGFERRVAIKRILPQLARDDVFRRMFLDEARIASHLHHANIVQVLDYGIVDGAEFIVFEFVDGIDAQRAAIRNGSVSAWPAAVALHVVSEVGHALAHAHSRRDPEGAPLGIVHRDVNPQNILLSWEGDVKLSDFGIAFARDRSERTEAGVIKGKWRYMAPEQRLGRPVSAAADVYALGTTLQVLLTGGETEDAAPPDADDEVRELIAQCCREDPAERPTAASVAERAAVLAQRRREASSRAALCEWLSLARTVPRPTSAFDEMLGVCLVPGGGEARSFTAVRERERDRSDRALAPTERAATADIRRRRARRRWLVGATALLLAGGLVGAGFWAAPGAERPKPAPVAARRAAAPITEAPRTEPTPAPEPAATTPAPAPQDEARVRPVTKARRYTPRVWPGGFSSLYVRGVDLTTLRGQANWSACWPTVVAPPTHGRARTFQGSVDENGRVTEVTYRPDEPAALMQCLAAHLRGLTLPAPVNGQPASFRISFTIYDD